MVEPAPKELCCQAGLRPSVLSTSLGFDPEYCEDDDDSDDDDDDADDDDANGKTETIYAVHLTQLCL